MDTKLLLIAASSLALAACGGSDVETAAEENDLENGPVETALSEEQPVLEGDSPFVDGEDVADSRLDQESYDTGFDGPDLGDDDDFAMDAEADVDADDSFAALAAESDRIADEAEREIEGAADEMQMAAADMADDTEGAARAAGSNLAATVTDGLSAKEFTANNTDAYINDQGELITGSEAALMAGTYTVAMEGMDDTSTLYVDGEGDQAVGTFNGEPIEVMVTGRNFTFDAPVMIDGEEELMTFAGTFENGMIENGVVSAQGDGGSMTFTAVRGDADTSMSAKDLLNETIDAGETLIEETGDAVEGVYDDAANAVDDIDMDVDTDADEDLDM